MTTTEWLPATYRPRTRRVLRAGITAGCAWEVLALTTNEIPPISHLCWRHRWLTVLTLGVLAHHLIDVPELAVSDPALSIS